MSDASSSAAPHFSTTSTNLLRRVQENQAAAWRRLVDLYGPLVWHWCRQADLQASDRADVLQRVFHSVFRRIGDFQRDPGGGSFRGWLLVITQNQIRDFYRQRRRHEQAAGGTEACRRLLELADPDADESQGAEPVHPVSRLLHEALASLQAGFDERTWRAFWLTAVDGRTSAEVGQELGMTAGAVRKAKARVLSRLRSELGDLG